MLITKILMNSYKKSLANSYKKSVTAFGIQSDLRDKKKKKKIFPGCIIEITKVSFRINGISDPMCAAIHNQIVTPLDLWICARHMRRRAESFVLKQRK